MQRRWIDSGKLGVFMAQFWEVGKGLHRDYFTRPGTRLCSSAFTDLPLRGLPRRRRPELWQRSDARLNSVANTTSSNGREIEIRSEQHPSETLKQQSAGPNGALDRSEHGKFVHFFRMASPYIEGHRGRTFVIVLPGEVHRYIWMLTRLLFFKQQVTCLARISVVVYNLYLCLVCTSLIS